MAEIVLHIPRLAPGAIPPLQYPPVPSHALKQAPLAGGIVAAGVLLHWLLRPDSFPARVLYLLFQVCVGYYFVSGRLLSRRPWWGCRYGATSPRELAKLWCLTPFVATCGVIPAASSSLVNVILSWVAYAVGLNYLLLDNSGFLQAFGCKFSAPSRWRTFTTGERLFGVGVVVTLLFIVGYHVLLWTGAAGTSAAVIGAQVGALALVFAVPALVFAATHRPLLHHYLVALLLLPLTNFTHDPVSLCIQGVVLAVLVEGCATWGLDPFLLPRSSSGKGLQATDLPTAVWLRLVGAVGGAAAADGAAVAAGGGDKKQDGDAKPGPPSGATASGTLRAGVAVLAAPVDAMVLAAVLAACGDAALGASSVSLASALRACHARLAVPLPQGILLPVPATGETTGEAATPFGRAAPLALAALEGCACAGGGCLAMLQAAEAAAAASAPPSGDCALDRLLRPRCSSSSSSASASSGRPLCAATLLAALARYKPASSPPCATLDAVPRAVYEARDAVVAGLRRGSEQAAFASVGTVAQGLAAGAVELLGASAVAAATFELRGHDIARGWEWGWPLASESGRRSYWAWHLALRQAMADWEAALRAPAVPDGEAAPPSRQLEGLQQAIIQAVWKLTTL